MFSISRQMRRVGLAVVAVGSIGLSGQAFAQSGTPSGDTVTNTATVNYTVASVVQTPVTATNQFIVDTVIKLNVTGGTNLNVTPGQSTGVFGLFTLTNTSNITSNFNFDLAVANRPQPAEDQFDIGALDVRFDANNNGIYEPATDTSVTSTAGLASGGSRRFFIVGTIPLTATNSQISLVRLNATAINPTTTIAWVNDAGADIQNGLPQIVVATASAFAQDSFTVQTATLAVTKNSSVISDNILPATGLPPKAIPGATMEYAIVIANSGSTAATLQSISDPLPAATTFQVNQYSSGTRDVSIQVNAAAPTFCIAESGGVDSNGDGCFRTGTTLTVNAPAITTVAASSTVTVRFRVNIN
jgi:uncharacterized repeat protein (TIGR01451 family)